MAASAGGAILGASSFLRGLPTGDAQGERIRVGSSCCCCCSSGASGSSSSSNNSAISMSVGRLPSDAGLRLGKARSLDQAAAARLLLLQQQQQCQPDTAQQQPLEGRGDGGASAGTGARRQAVSFPSNQAVNGRPRVGESLQSPHSEGTGEAAAAAAAAPAAAAGAASVVVAEEDVVELVDSLESKYHPLRDEALVQSNVRALLALGARRRQVLRMAARQPQLLRSSIAEETAALAALFSRFNIPRAALLRALARSLDCLLAVDVGHGATVLEFLDKELGVNNLGRVVSVSPHLLGQPVSDLDATVSVLQSALGLPDVGGALERNPALLGWGSGDVARRVAVLGALVKGGAGEVRRMVEGTGGMGLMVVGVEDAEATCGHLVSLLGEGAAMELVAAQPQVLALDPDAVRHAVSQMVTLFGSQTAGEVLSANGSLARRRWDATARKLEYITRVMGRDLAQVAAWPRVLSYNLASRLQRRYEALAAAGKGESESLRAMFGCSDSVFERRFGVALTVRPKGKRGRKPKAASSVGTEAEDNSSPPAVAPPAAAAPAPAPPAAAGGGAGLL